VGVIKGKQTFRTKKITRNVLRSDVCRAMMATYLTMLLGGKSKYVSTGAAVHLE
jgi:hypothetical protein